MTTFVLIHGGFHGGWVWEPVAARLAALGHRAIAPTLAGMAHRAASPGTAVTLDMQIDEIAEIVQALDTRQVVLCGHSFGGIVITAIADRLPERVSALVYLDALIPRDGQSAGELMGLDPAAYQDGVPPPPAAAFRLADPADIWLTDRLMTPQPIGTVTAPIRLTGRHAGVAYRSYVLSRGFPTIHPDAPFDRAATHARLSNDPAWRTEALDCGHNAMRDDPDAVVRILLDAAAGGDQTNLVSTSAE